MDPDELALQPILEDRHERLVAKRAIRGGITAVATLPFGVVGAAWFLAASRLLPFALIAYVAFVGTFGVSRILVGRDQLRALKQRRLPPPVAPLPTARVL